MECNRNHRKAVHEYSLHYRTFINLILPKLENTLSEKPVQSKSVTSVCCVLNDTVNNMKAQR